MLGSIVLLLIVSGCGYALWRAHRLWSDRQQLSEARMASFVAQVQRPALPEETPQERLLFDAAGKTAQAGEPVLAIQLYARLLSRYPQSGLATQARAAVAEQKKKLARP